MSKRAVVFLACLAVAIIALLLIPAFLLPDPLYDCVYGWRYPKSRPVGDLSMIDRGPNASDGRYQIDMSLPRDGKASGTLVLTNLPSVQLYIGALVPLTTDRWDPEFSHLSNTRLTIHVTDSTGTDVCSTDGLMAGDWRKWFWSGPYGKYAFLYGSANFIPLQNASYRLSYAVDRPNTLPAGTLLHVRGGGWK